MGEFFAKAWATPSTTFGAIVAICAMLGPELAGAPAGVITGFKVLGGLAAIFAGMAARDSSTPGPVSAAAGKDGAK